MVPEAHARQASTACDAITVPGDRTYLTVHDGARSPIRPELIDHVVLDAHRYGATSLVIPARDTMERTDTQGSVVRTLPHEQLWGVQAPQIFQRELYESVLRVVQREYTDDYQLIGQTGGQVHLHESSPENAKLVTPEDVLFARAVLHGKEGGSK